MAQINSAPVSDKCWHKGNVRLRRGNADVTNADAGRIRRHILRIWPKRHGGPNRSLASVIRSRRAILAQFLVARAVGDERTCDSPVPDGTAIEIKCSALRVAVRCGDVRNPDSSDSAPASSMRRATSTSIDAPVRADVYVFTAQARRDPGGRRHTGRLSLEAPNRRCQQDPVNSLPAPTQ